jgi:beta-glucosidase-like glycosyl hydrolase
VLSAVQDGTISEQRIDESVTRILTLKANYGLL